MLKSLGSKMFSKRQLLLGMVLIPAAANASSGGGKKEASETDFVATSQVTATIMSGFKPVGLMQIDVGVYTKDKALKAKLNSLRPVLIANWRGALQDFCNRFYTVGNVPDANILVPMLQKAISQQIGGANARVLIEAIIAR